MAPWAHKKRLREKKTLKAGGAMKTKQRNKERKFQQRCLSVVITISTICALLPFIASCSKNESPLEKEKRAFQERQKRTMQKEVANAGDYKDRGDAYLVKGNVGQAISDYTKAIEINPDDGEAYNNRAIMYFGEKEYAKAKEDVRRAQALGYEVSPQLLKNLSDEAIAKSVSHLDKEKFMAVYRFAKALEEIDTALVGLGTSYYGMLSTVDTLSSEIAFAKDKVSTDDERQLLALYKSALECYQDGMTLWKIADEYKYEEDINRYNKTAEDRLRYLDVIERTKDVLTTLFTKYEMKLPSPYDYEDSLSKPLIEAASTILKRAAKKLNEANKVILSN